MSLNIVLPYELKDAVRQALASHPDFRIGDSVTWYCGDIHLHLVCDQVAEQVAKRPQRLGSDLMTGAILEGCHTCEEYLVVGLLTEHPIGVCMTRAAHRRLTCSQKEDLKGFCRVIVTPEQLAS